MKESPYSIIIWNFRKTKNKLQSSDPKFFPRWQRPNSQANRHRRRRWQNDKQRLNLIRNNGAAGLELEIIPRVFEFEKISRTEMKKKWGVRRWPLVFLVRRRIRSQRLQWLGFDLVSSAHRWSSIVVRRSRFGQVRPTSVEEDSYITMLSSYRETSLLIKWFAGCLFYLITNFIFFFSSFVIWYFWPSL